MASLIVKKIWQCKVSQTTLQSKWPLHLPHWWFDNIMSAMNGWLNGWTDERLVKRDGCFGHEFNWYYFYIFTSTMKLEMTIFVVQNFRSVETIPDPMPWPCYWVGCGHLLVTQIAMGCCCLFWHKIEIRGCLP